MVFSKEYCHAVKNTAVFAMCQATFAMMFAKKYGIMVDVNKKVLLCPLKVGYLYNMHKFTCDFL